MPKKQLDCDLKLKLKESMEKESMETDSVKYLGIQVGEGLTLKKQINHMAVKLNKANACQN